MRLWQKSFGAFCADKSRRFAARGVGMNINWMDALPVVGFIGMTLSFRLFHNRTKYKKLFRICDVLVHLALVGFLLYVDASMEELLLVLLVALAIGLA